MSTAETPVAGPGGPIDHETEIAVMTPSGEHVVVSAASADPCGVSYVRFVNADGQETAYWISDEWMNNSEGEAVMGAIFGAMISGGQIVAVMQDPDNEDGDPEPGCGCGKNCNRSANQPCGDMAYQMARDNKYRPNDIPPIEDILNGGTFVESYPVDEDQSNSNAGDAEVWLYCGKKYEIITWNERAFRRGYAISILSPDEEEDGTPEAGEADPPE